jgi:hypothetical protein
MTYPFKLSFNAPNEKSAPILYLNWDNTSNTARKWSTVHGTIHLQHPTISHNMPYYSGLWKVIFLQWRLIPWRRVPEKLTISQQVKKIPHFMEHESLLLCSQGSTNGSYPEPQESSLHAHTLIKITSNNIPSTHSSLKWDLPFRFSGYAVSISSMRAMVSHPSHPPSFDHPNNIWRRVQKYEVPHWVIFSFLMLLSLF